MGAFKSVTTHRYVRGVKESGWRPFDGRLWQRNYYEHVIRSDADLTDLRRYVEENPLRWALDEENPRPTSSRVPAVLGCRMPTPAPAGGA